MPYHLRTGWTASADGYVPGYEPQNVLDENESSFWYPVYTGNPHYINIDMKADKHYDCIWWEAWQGSIGFPAGPHLVRVYKSDNGTTWSGPLLSIRNEGYAVWSGSKRYDVFHLNEVHTSRFIRIMTNKEQITCQNIYVGVLGQADPYKRYYIAYPRAFDNVDSATGGEVTLKSRQFRIQLWRTRPLGDWPAPVIFSSDWHLPSDVKSHIEDVEQIAAIHVADQELNPEYGYFYSPITALGGLLEALYRYDKSLNLSPVGYYGSFDEWPTTGMDIVIRGVLWDIDSSDPDPEHTAKKHILEDGILHTRLWGSISQTGDRYLDYAYVWPSDHYLLIIIQRPPMDCFTDSATSATSFAH